MSFVNAYDTKTGRKLPYLVPESHIDHPVLGKRLSRFPSAKQRARQATAAVDPVNPPDPTEAPTVGDDKKE